MGKFFKVAMFYTSFIPLWITVIFIGALSILRKESNLYTEIISISVIIILIVISSWIIISSMKKIENNCVKEYKIEDVTQEKGITSEFLLSYILPLFAFDFTKWDSIIEFLIYFIILSFLCIRNNNVYANILFECLGYKFYSCELSWTAESNVSNILAVVISKCNLCANKGNKIKISLLNKPFYIMKDL